MIKYNKDYSKRDENGYPLYAPIPLVLHIPHHEEWDEDVIDPETGEPTGETIHRESDWIEDKYVQQPEAADWAQAGYLRLYDIDPGPHEQGKHWQKTGKINGADTCYVLEYVLVDDPPPPPRTFSKLKVVAALTKAGVWDSAKQLLIERKLYDLFLAAQDFRGDNEDFKNGKDILQSTLGWTDDQVEAVLAASVKE